MEIIVKSSHPIVLLSLKKDVPNGASVFVPPIISRRDISVVDALNAIVTVSRDIEIGLLGAWLFEKTKIDQNYTTVYINRVEVQLEHGEIVRVLSEQIKQTSES